MQQSVAEKINRFFSQFELKSKPKGAIITDANQDPSGIMFLVEGVVEQYYLLPNGSKVTVNVFKPPAFFPMSWAINRTPNEYFYATQTDIAYRQADPAQTVVFLQSQPEVVFDLLSRVYRGTDALLKRLVVASSGSATNRLIFELVIESLRFGEEADSSRKLIKIKQNTLADRSGLARETVSRELHKLSVNGLLELTKTGIIVDVSKLEQQLLAQI